VLAVFISTMTLEQAYSKARLGLRYHMEQSVALLRKAERLATLYDPENGFYLAFSGGKDSQALYHIAKLAGVPFKGHFSPTTVDPPQVIRFIKKNYPDIEFEKVTKSIYTMALEKRIFPTQKFRWCCAEFKEKGGVGKVVLTGVRHQESMARSKRMELEISGRKFAGTIEEFQEWRVERLRKANKSVNQDEFTRDKKQEVACISGKDKIIVNPIIEWSDADVWEFLNAVVEVPHCELYDPPYNQHRVGCIMCPMSGYKRKVADSKMYPYVYEKWVQVAEKLIRGGGTPQSGNNSRRTVGKKKVYRWRNGVTNTPPPTEILLTKPLPNLLVDWWMSGLPWDEFVDKMSHPSLFED